MFERNIVVPARAELITYRDKIAMPETRWATHAQLLVTGIPRVDKSSHYWMKATFDPTWGKVGGWFTDSGKAVPLGRIVGIWNPKTSSPLPMLHTKEELRPQKNKDLVVESRKIPNHNTRAPRRDGNVPAGKTSYTDRQAEMIKSARTHQE